MLTLSWCLDTACHHNNSASAGFRQAEVSRVLSKQTVESNSFCLDGDVEMMSLLLLFLLLEAVLIIISAAPKPPRYQHWFVITI